MVRASLGVSCYLMRDSGSCILVQDFEKACRNGAGDVCFDLFQSKEDPYWLQLGCLQHHSNSCLYIARSELREFNRISDNLIDNLDVSCKKKKVWASCNELGEYYLSKKNNHQGLAYLEFACTLSKYSCDLYSDALLNTGQKLLAKKFSQKGQKEFLRQKRLVREREGKIENESRKKLLAKREFKFIRKIKPFKPTRKTIELLYQCLNNSIIKVHREYRTYYDLIPKALFGKKIHLYSDLWIFESRHHIAYLTKNYLDLFRRDLAPFNSRTKFTIPFRDGHIYRDFGNPYFIKGLPFKNSAEVKAENKQDKFKKRGIYDVSSDRPANDVIYKMISNEFSKKLFGKNSVFNWKAFEFVYESILRSFDYNDKKVSSPCFSKCPPGLKISTKEFMAKQAEESLNAKIAACIPLEQHLKRDKLSELREKAKRSCRSKIVWTEKAHIWTRLYCAYSTESADGILQKD
ncbi:MAG: hypothetical protein R3B45_16790 [Bdellovibrionota bacterium]